MSESPPPPPDDYGAPPSPNYGHLPPPPPRDSDFAPVEVAVSGTNQYAKLSLFLGLVGWVVCGIGSLVGVYYGFKALNEIKSTGQDGREKAIAGILIGSAMSVLILGTALSKAIS